jgi:hypothetical protein
MGDFNVFTEHTHGIIIVLWRVPFPFPFPFFCLRSVHIIIKVKIQLSSMFSPAKIEIVIWDVEHVV